MEDYTHTAWHPEYACPKTCPKPCLPQPPDYKGPGCPLSCLTPCRADALAAGEWIMRAVLAAFPAAQLLTSHGPWLSYNRTAEFIEKTMPGFEAGGNWAKDNPLVGVFDIGPLAGTAAAFQEQGATGRYLDGGEIYMQSTAVDVARSRRWMKLNVSTSELVPPALRGAKFSQHETVSFGVYDFPKIYHGKGPGTPAMWENDITVSLRGMDPDGITWAYSEAFDWVGLGKHATGKPPVPKEWLASTARARAAGQM